MVLKMTATLRKQIPPMTPASTGCGSSSGSWVRDGYTSMPGAGSRERQGLGHPRGTPGTALPPSHRGRFGGSWWSSRDMGVAAVGGDDPGPRWAFHTSGFGPRKEGRARGGGGSPGLTCRGDVHRVAGIADVAAGKGHQAELVEGVLGEQRTRSFVGSAVTRRAQGLYGTTGRPGSGWRRRRSDTPPPQAAPRFPP